MSATIRAVEYYLPEHVLGNEELCRQFTDWTPEKIESKTGIRERRIAGDEEFSSDLAVKSAEKLFDSGACSPADIDYLLLCTQSPDYFLPTTACILQDRLGIPTSAGALDFNLGCSGYVYGLGLAKGLIETQQARNVLLITAETYSKFMHADDRGTRSIFGDAAAATLVAASESENANIGPFVFGTDGRGAENLIVRGGGVRNPSASVWKPGGVVAEEALFMDGPEIFNFTLRAVPQCVRQLLAHADKKLDEIDLYVFHQANRYMLDHLRKKLGVPEERFYVLMNHCGNTVSSTIPIALKHAVDDGRLKAGQTAMLVGFGVGYSWGGTLIRWD
jgi:3-oxoacyl-[acyl-carrier-protein] synthase-3